MFPRLPEIEDDLKQVLVFRVVNLLLHVNLEYYYYITRMKMGLCLGNT